MTRTDNNSASSSGCVRNRRLQKTDSLKENEGTVKQGRLPTSTRASRSAFASYQGSATMTTPPSVVMKMSYPPYDYADNIPRPKVIYIKKEEEANNMIASLNGQVSLSQIVPVCLRMNYHPSAVGLDLEWPFTPDSVGVGKEGKVALVQLCDTDIILLIQVSKMQGACIWLVRVMSGPTFHTRVSREGQSTEILSSFPCGTQRSQELIESPEVPKVGVNIRSE
jgi:hypothetical protein